MNRHWNLTSGHFADGVKLLLGLWLIASPWALGYTSPMGLLLNAYLAGAIIAVASLVALFAFQKWEQWVNVAIGAWLVASPWVLGFSGFAYATWNHVGVGALVAVLALWLALRASPREAAGAHASEHQPTF